jgi:hypothetical protein
MNVNVFATSSETAAAVCASADPKRHSSGLSAYSSKLWQSSPSYPYFSLAYLSVMMEGMIPTVAPNDMANRMTTATICGGPLDALKFIKNDSLLLGRRDCEKASGVGLENEEYPSTGLSAFLGKSGSVGGIFICPD